MSDPRKPVPSIDVVVEDAIVLLRKDGKPKLENAVWVVLAVCQGERPAVVLLTPDCLFLEVEADPVGPGRSRVTNARFAQLPEAA